jgi:hypothetical protein
MTLLRMMTLSYAFLLSLLASQLEWMHTRLLRQFCYHIRRRGREGPTPLYRLRWALSSLWFAHPGSSGPDGNYKCQMTHAAELGTVSSAGIPSELAFWRIPTCVS